MSGNLYYEFELLLGFVFIVLIFNWLCFVKPSGKIPYDLIKLICTFISLFMNVSYWDLV
jgi:hypothetical protein